MPSPLLYEVNTRVWLRELSEEHGRAITLVDVPDTEIERWKGLGFTHIWLMGVWQIGPKAREVALTFWREHWSRDIPSAAEADVIGSPYAIEEYSVDSRLGDALSLLMLKERFGRVGLHLILDFVPNHFGIDSTEPTRFPVRFVHSTDPAPGTFEAEARFGKRYFAHGKDPYFDPWIDTVQLDYRVLETHQAMRAVAQTASMYGDGLRCDMAMLLLPEVFAETWKNFPSQAAHKIDTGFWRKTIQEIRQVQPHVELIAEAYWDREEQLQELGFDYTYNKRVCDYLVHGQHDELLEYIGKCSPKFLARSVHFIENHDEKRAASIFNAEQHALAAALILFLPGMALLHDGQLEGRRVFSRIQLTKRAAEELDPKIMSLYGDLLAVLQQSHVRRGKPKVTTLREQSTLVVEWMGQSESDFAVVNFGADPAMIDVQGQEVLYCSSVEKPEFRSGSVVVSQRSAAIVRGAHKIS